MKDKKIIMIVMFILTAVISISVYKSAVSITRKGQINARVIAINDGIFTTQILVYKDGEALSYHFDKDKMYKDLLSTTDEYIELSFYQTAIGEILGIDPQLNTYRLTKTRTPTSFKKMNINLICTFLGSLKKDEKLYSDVVKNLNNVSDFQTVSSRCKSRS